MASAGSARKLRSPVVVFCTICEGKNEVKWKCVNCDKIICQNCKNLHKKVRATSHHKIVSLKKKKNEKDDDTASVVNLEDKKSSKLETISTDSTSLETNDEQSAGMRIVTPKAPHVNIRPTIMCKKHPNVPLRWYCGTCEITVCKDCAIRDHKSHVMADLSVTLDRKQRKWEKLLKFLEEKELPNTVERMKMVKKAKLDFDSNIIAVKREVWMRYDEFMLKLGNQREKILGDLDDIQQREEKVFSRAQEQIDQELSVLESATNAIKNMIESLNTLTVPKTFDEVCKRVKDISKTTSPNPQKVLFNAHKITDSIIHNLYGKLERCLQEMAPLQLSQPDCSPASTPDIDVSILSSFATSLPFIRTICPISDDQAWIGCWQHDQMYLTSSDGIQSKNYSGKVMDATLMPTGDILIVCYLSHNLMCIQKSGKMKEWKSDLTLYPTGVVANGNGDIFLSLVDRYDLTMDENSIRRILKLDNDGSIVMNIENDENQQPIFTYPAKVTLNINGDICAIDETGEYSGRLVVFNSEGEKKFEYGDKDTTFEETCDLSSCACDPFARIVVSDWLHHKIHILSEEGVFIGYLLTEDDGIHFPFCLSFGSDGLLWIGCKLRAESDTGGIVRIKFRC